MSEILIQSKVTAPRLNNKIVHRGRLTSLLHENIDRSLIIVCAPAGFGKTTLVLDYLTQYKINYAWFSIPHNGIEDTSTFFEYLIGCVSNINPEFGKDTQDVLKQFSSNPKMAKDLVYKCTASFVNEFQKCFKEDIILVIDDLHYIESEKSKTWLKDFFSELLDNMPANLHLILVSRVLPDINLTALKAKRNVFVIDEKELNFTKEETEKLLKDIYRVSYDQEDIKVLDENIKGWITGLHLLLQAYGEDFVNVKFSIDISFKNIYDFFAQEIFNNLSTELQEFMMVTSLMETFNDELVNSVLGITNSRELTEELLQKNLFIHQINILEKEEKNINYGYHALFREFLNRKLKHSRFEHDIKDLIEKIGDGYLKNGDKVNAIEYYIESGNSEKAILLIIERFQKVFETGMYDLLWKWFNSLQDEIIDKNAMLSYSIATLYLYTKTDYERSLHHINNAIELFKLDNDEDGLLKCSYVKNHILQYSGKNDLAIKEWVKLLDICNKPKNVIKIYNRLSDCYNFSNKFKEAEETLQKAVKYCDDNKVEKSLREKLNFAFALFYHKTHQYEKALYYFKKDLENPKAAYNKIVTYGNIAVTYNDMGNFAKSIKYTNIAFELLNNSNSREMLVHLSAHKALLLQKLGDFEESIKILLSVYPQVQKSNSIMYSYLFTDYLFMNCYLTGDYSNCLHYLKLNKTFADALDNEYYKKIYQAHEAIINMRQGVLQSVEEKLIDSHNFFNSVKNSSSSIVLPWLSEYYMITNKFKQASDYMKIYLKESCMDANDITNSRSLINFALSRPELSHYKDKVHQAFTQFFDRLNIEGTSDEYKQKMKIEIENLYDLKMNAFDGLVFISRGEVIPESKWRRKKSRYILAYMMLDPKQKYSREHLTDLFFSDTKAKNINDTFRHEISAMNNAVKLPYLSIMQHEGKMLFLNPDCYFKSDVSEFDKYYRQINSDKTNKEEKIHACKEAIELYKGDFLKDNYEKWCEDLRDQYRNKYISISEMLLDLLSEIKDYDNIIFYSEKLLSFDKLNEHAYLKLVEAHVESGKTRTAKETYSKMLKIFEEELAEKPDNNVLSRIDKLIK